MGRFWNLNAFICVSLVVAGCSRPLTGDLSKISIQLPTEQHLGKIGALSSLPANRKACFGVNVTGPGISLSGANTCSPKTGVLAGFAEPGQVIEAKVPRGSDRSIKLYVFLQEVGQNIPCPTFAKTMTPTQLLNTYLVGTKEKVNLSAPEVTVSITMSFPGLSQNLAQQLSLPNTCTNEDSMTSLPGFGVSSAAGQTIGTGIKLKAKVGTIKNGQTLTGTGVKLYVRQ